MSPYAGKLWQNAGNFFDVRDVVRRYAPAQAFTEGITKWRK